MKRKDAYRGQGPFAMVAASRDREANLMKIEIEYCGQ